MIHQWIEYSLVVLNGSGNQPYETLVPLGVAFDGGYYVENGRYRGRLSGDTEEQINAALLTLSMFGVQPLTGDNILTIVERVHPTNTPWANLPDSAPLYVGPATLDSELRIVRDYAETPF